MQQTRWKNIADEIRDAIARNELRPGDRIGSESDLAERFGVSRMTAHRAMHELQVAGIVVRKPRIGTVVAEPKAARRAQTQSIGVLFYNSNSHPQANYLRGMSAALPDNHRLVYFDSEDDPQREADLLQQARRDCQAILCYPTCAPQNTPLLQEILDSGLPLVCVDRIPAGVDADAVLTDNYGSSLEAMRFLTAKGHRHIAHFTDSTLHVSSVQERCAGYQQALIEQGVSPTRLLRLFPAGEHWDFARLAQAIYDALFTQLRHPDPPTAVFCVHDQYMAAVLSVCDSLNLSVPDDIEILSFNDAPTLPILNLDSVHRIIPEITTIGRLASERLQRRFAHDDVPAETIRVPAKIQYATAVNVPFNRPD